MNISRALELLKLLYETDNLDTVKIKIKVFDNDYRSFSGTIEFSSVENKSPYYEGSLVDLKNNIGHYTSWSGESYSYSLMVWPKTGEKGTYGVLPVIDLPLDFEDCVSVLDLYLKLISRQAC